jgi:uncharacterized membrane protein YqaE (UPF0057 family)
MGYKEPATTEAEILGAVRRFELRRKTGLILAMFGVVVGAIAAFQFVPGDPTDASPTETLAFGISAVVCFAAGIALIFSGRIPPEAKTQRIAMLRAEQLQSLRQQAFLLMPLSLGFMLVGVVGAAYHAMHGQPMRHVEMFVVAAFLIFVILFALLLSGRGLDRWAKPVLDDELSRELRGRALQLGYAILLPGVAVLFAVGLFRRDLAVELAPVVAALGIAGPAIRLYMLERAANADGGDA